MTPDDATLFVEASLDDVRTIPFCGGTAAVFSRPSPTSTGPNQDAAALIPYDADRGVIVVADGAGGLQGGAQASCTTVQAMRAALEVSARANGILREAVLDGIESAHGEVIALGIGAATTVAVAEVRGNHIRPYHAGDSQILVVGARGDLKLLTVSHSPMGYAVQAGLLDEREAMVHADRHFVLNVVGAPGMHIEMGMDVALDPGDTLLVACDGLFDNLTTSEIVTCLHGSPLERATAELVERTRERMDARDRRPSKPDDLTLVTFRFEIQPGSGT